MAVLKNNLFGELTGRIGNVVHYTLRGRTVMRIIGRNEHPPTLRQLGNRQGMKVVSEFLKPVDWFIRLGFALEAADRNIYPQNAAVSYHKKYALKGSYPNVEMDYPKALLSRGDLPGLRDPVVQLGSGRDVWIR